MIENIENWNEQVENWNDQFDHLGLFGDLDSYIKQLSIYCPGIKTHQSYYYHTGMVTGRLPFERPNETLSKKYESLIVDENGMLKETNGLHICADKIFSLSFKDLYTFIQDAESNSLKNSHALSFLKGLYHGKQIHIEFEGIGGDQYKITGFDYKLNGFRLKEMKPEKIIKEHRTREKLRLQQKIAGAHFYKLKAKIKTAQDKKDYEEENRLYLLLKRAYKRWIEKRLSIEDFERELEEYFLKLELEEARFNQLRLLNCNYGFANAFQGIMNDLFLELIPSLFSGPTMG